MAGAPAAAARKPLPARLREKLLKARDTKAIGVCQPTAIKAFLLKLVQCFHLLSLSRSADDAESVGGAIASAFGNLTRGLKRAVGGHDAHAEQVAALREQAERCVEVYQLFQSSALLLDEVDLCLHPLKAELNWPLGDKLALDFTQGERQGLRWRIPFFLLDGIFYVVAGTPAARVDRAIARLSQYRVGGDGATAMKTLNIYIKNLVNKPAEFEKFRTHRSCLSLSRSVRNRDRSLVKQRAR